MISFSDPQSSLQSTFIVFLCVCVIIACVLELYKWFYTSQASGYLFSNTRSAFEPEIYSQTNPHLMVPSRNENLG
jgi:hypothetical protein